MVLVNVVQTVEEWKQNPPQLAGSTKQKEKQLIATLYLRFAFYNIY